MLFITKQAFQKPWMQWLRIVLFLTKDIPHLHSLSFFFFRSRNYIIALVISACNQMAIKGMDLSYKYSDLCLLRETDDGFS